MPNENENVGSANAEAWMALSPEQDITAYDLWRCLMIGQSVRPDEVVGIPKDLRRHYKMRHVGEY